MTVHEMLGQKIACIFTCFEYLEKYNCTVQSIFLQFDTGEVLSIPNADEELCIPWNNEKLLSYAEGECCKGATIIDVLDSVLPNYSLLLSNNKLVFGDSPIPSQFKWYIDDFSEEFRERYEFRSIRVAER